MKCCWSLPSRSIFARSPAAALKSLGLGLLLCLQVEDTGSNFLLLSHWVKDI